MRDTTGVWSGVGTLLAVPETPFTSRMIRPLGLPAATLLLAREPWRSNRIQR
jgi:hypothetical protein